MSEVQAPKKRLRNLSDDAAHILVVDDDVRIRTLLSRYLVEHGFRVSSAGNADEARKNLETLSFDALVVDVMMPGENGFELTEALKRVMDVPILMLTARSDNSDRIKGLELGADDYLTKPFEPRELVLRLQNLIKRAPQHQADAIEESEVIELGELSFNILTGDLQKHDGSYVRLTEKERTFLQHFAKARGRTVSRDELIGLADKTNGRAVDVHINRLRRKIEDDPTHPRLLETVRGLGYRLRVNG